MRYPRSPAWGGCAVFAAALAIAVAGLAPGAAAEEKFQKLVVFGDSYADVTMSDTVPTNALGPAGFALGFWRVYPVPLQQKLGIPVIEDIAVAGATASPTAGNPSPFITPPGMTVPGNLPQQVDAFLNGGGSFGPRDLITISIGGNDGIGFTLGVGDINLAPFAGAATAATTVAQIDRLVAAGGKTFVLASFSGLAGLPLITVGGGDPNVANAFGAAFFSGMQAQLLPYAQAGVRFFLLDEYKLGQQVQANLGRYGLTGLICNVPAFPAAPGTPCDGGVGSPLQQQFLFGPDGLHFTNRGFEIIAAYMANIVMAPDTIVVQPGLVTTVTGGFAASLLNRLGGVRQLNGGAGTGDPDGLMGIGAAKKAAGPTGGITSFAMGTFQGGDRDERTDLAGYKYEATAGTAGIEFSLNRNLIFGLAGNYTTADADLTSGATIDIDATQGAAYFSYATRNAFADALFAFGAHDLGLVRPGVLDPVRSSTDATAVALAARTGYLFDIGALRAGPIAGVTYVHTRVNGYAEVGDPLLTFNVSTQTLDTVTGSLGVRFLAPFKAWGGVVVPYLNITLEHQLGDDSHTLTAALQQAPLLPILTPAAAFDVRTYGRVEGGITVQLGADLSATFTGASTFARDEGQDYRFSGGLNFKF